MPLYTNGRTLVRQNLEALRMGQQVWMVPIGRFTATQHLAINRQLNMHAQPLMRDGEIYFIGQHLNESRGADRYSIEDMVDMIENALHPEAFPITTKGWLNLRGQPARRDRYGNLVHDTAVIRIAGADATAELFSVIPKGDVRRPVHQQRKRPR